VESGEEGSTFQFKISFQKIEARGEGNPFAESNPETLPVLRRCFSLSAGANSGVRHDAGHWQ